MKLFKDDLALYHALKKSMDEELLTWAEKPLNNFHELCYNEFDERAVHTDREGQPKLVKYNKLGDDVSYIWVNEGYKKTVEQTYNSGIVGYVHKTIPELNRKGNYMLSYAQGYLLSQVEPGFYCPVTLTMATAYLIEHFADEELKANYLPHVISTGEVELYEGATFLSERQGGSDVGANEVRAEKCGDHYQLFGEKYFASNAGMCGVATVLARIDGAESGTKGLSLFLVPWKKDDGSLNGIEVRRLKDKLGVRAVPSAEIVFNGATAYLIGDPKKGFYYMMEALNLSRVCNAVASIGIMRRAYVEAKNYAEWREAFGNKIITYPMVRKTLVDLLARYEVQTSAVFELIPLFDRVMTNLSQATKQEKAMNRLLIALLKARTAEEAIDFSHEAIEIHGGNGYMEDFVTPRLLRDAQVLTVWEGTANILGLEVLRLFKKFNVHSDFMNMISSKLESLPTYLDAEAGIVKQKLEKLKETVAYVTSKSEQEETYHIKSVANLMTDIYLCTVALTDVESEGDRKHLLAKVFIAHTWDDGEVIDTSLLPLTHFDELVYAKGSEVEIHQ
ncbi:acyl-CoA dehydrogenase family protein [Calidifontibacillus oryziterrae]|uniref:acyl-CoA dehydrogenase family protein n=1 Tax=Calidifontibacillus oryziterrae TaxID=1191699 RepID=UPI00031CEC48|nr:acyl-CoA dehydrogenase family protein [Calidifontibacillus oryziterrae]